MRAISTTEQITRALGGQWKYNAKAGWWDSLTDEARVVPTINCDCDGPCPHPSCFYLYGRGAPQRVSLSVTGDILELSQGESNA